jgi:hypothetical protein
MPTPIHWRAARRSQPSSTDSTATKRGAEHTINAVVAAGTPFAMP